MLTIRDVTERQGVSADTVKRAIKNGFLPAHRIGSRGDYRIAAEDYEAWLAAGAKIRPAKTSSN